MAVALTALVCWLFLGSLSSTMNVVLAIPMSLLGTVAVVYFCGFTLNTFTLLGLSLAVGLAYQAIDFVAPKRVIETDREPIQPRPGPFRSQVGPSCATSGWRGTSSKAIRCTLPRKARPSVK